MLWSSDCSPVCVVLSENVLLSRNHQERQGMMYRCPWSSYCSLVCVVLSENVLFLRYRLEQAGNRSEEHTSELQSRFDLVCRLLLEKKKEDRENHILC